jgi:hypothetical protein
MGDAIVGVGAAVVGLLTALSGARGEGLCGKLGGPVTSCPADTGKVATGFALLAMGAFVGSSAISGFVWTAECQELERQRAACFAGEEEACAALREPHTVPGPAAGPRPRERPDRGLEAGNSCGVDAECRAGLACRLGRCAVVQAP